MGFHNRRIVDTKNIDKNYVIGTRKIQVLKNISLQVLHGEFIAIVGPSGNGKSTLLNMITGIDRPSTGEVYVNDAPIHRMGENALARWRCEHLGIIFQFFQLLPALSLVQNVILPMDFAGRMSSQKKRSRALELLELVGLKEHANQLPSLVSGGQQQRAAIARALANDPPLIVADEPTGNLDVHTSKAIFSLFEELIRRGKTIIMVTHDNELACNVPRRIEIRDGIIAQDGACYESI